MPCGVPIIVSLLSARRGPTTLDGRQVSFVILTQLSLSGSIVVVGQGVLAFWSGFGPATIKLAPVSLMISNRFWRRFLLTLRMWHAQHSVISFIILDNLTIWYTGKSAM